MHLPTSLKLRLSSAFFLLLFLPTSGLAVDDLFFRHQPVVTRGDFLRAAVKQLNISYGTGTADVLPYDRVPQAMVPYVAAAHREHALGSFGASLRLSTPITRGEAARVVVELLNERSSQHMR